MPLSLSEERARCSVALDWLAGRLPPREPPPSTGDTIVLRASAHPREDAFVVQEVFRPAFAMLERMSGGRITVRDAWGETAHPASEGFEALADGRTDFAPCYTSWDAQRYPLATLLALPGLFPSSEVATGASELLYPRYLREEFERPGVCMGRLKATGPYHLFARKPLHRLRDIAGLKVAVNAGIDSRIAAALGARPVPLRSDQLRAAFAAGEVDAVSLADGSSDVFGIGVQAGCRLELGVSMMNLEFGLASAFVARLSLALRAVLNDWLRAQSQAEAQVFYGVGGALARERFARHGCVFTSLDAADARELQATMDELSDRIAGEVDARGLPGRCFVADARAYAARYAGASANDLMREALEHPRWILPGERPAPT